MIRKPHSFLIWVIAMALVAVVQVWAQKPEESKPGMENSSMHQKHMEEMNARGNHAMGFDQAKTIHHFTLLAGGGVIQV